MALLFVAPPIQSQTIESSVDIGAMALRYADTVSTGAFVLSPRALFSWPSGFAEAAATLSQFTAGGWSAQGLLLGSRFIPTGPVFFAELAGLAGGSTHNDGTRTGEIVANGRLHYPRGRGEFFAGAGVGRTYDGETWRRLLLGELGASVGSSERNALVSLGPAMVNDSIKYADLQGSLNWKTKQADFGAVLGVRFGDQLTNLNDDARSWASISALRQLNRRVAVTLSGGTYPIDPTQGFPGGRFVSAALRIDLGGASPMPAAPETNQSPPAGAISSFTARRDTGNVMVLTVTAAGANLVEINGDFTNWSPLAMTPDSLKSGSWVVKIPLRPGTYQMNVRLDGGSWIVPPGILSMRDEFGGTVGLLVIE